jgi:hypothetical protein
VVKIWEVKRTEVPWIDFSRCVFLGGSERGHWIVEKKEDVSQERNTDIRG